MAGAEEADAAVDAGGGRHRDMQARLDEGCVEDVGVDRAGSVQSGGHLARWWLQDLSVVLERSGWLSSWIHQLGRERMYTMSMCF